MRSKQGSLAWPIKGTRTFRIAGGLGQSCSSSCSPTRSSPLLSEWNFNIRANHSGGGSLSAIQEAGGLELLHANMQRSKPKPAPVERDSGFKREDRPHQSTSWDDLPEDLVYHIAKLCSPEERRQLRRVGRECKAAVDNATTRLRLSIDVEAPLRPRMPVIPHDVAERVKVIVLEFKWPSSYQLDDLAAGLHRLFVDRFSATFPNAVVHLNVSENEPLLCKEEHPEDLATMHEVHRALSDVKVWPLVEKFTFEGEALEVKDLAAGRWGCNCATATKLFLQKIADGGAGL